MSVQHTFRRLSIAHDCTVFCGDNDAITSTELKGTLRVRLLVDFITVVEIRYLFLLRSIRGKRKRVREDRAFADSQDRTFNLRTVHSTCAGIDTCISDRTTNALESARKVALAGPADLNPLRLR
jgi:hypothetical protein